MKVRAGLRSHHRVPRSTEASATRRVRHRDPVQTSGRARAMDCAARARRPRHTFGRYLQRTRTPPATCPSPAAAGARSCQRPVGHPSGRQGSDYANRSTDNRSQFHSTSPRPEATWRHGLRIIPPIFHSSGLEKVLEHRFIAELTSCLWLKVAAVISKCCDPRSMPTGTTSWWKRAACLRHIQLKSMVTRRQEASRDGQHAARFKAWRLRHLVRL